MALIRQEPVAIDEIRVSHSLDMQFVGQTHILQVPLPDDQVNRAAIQTAFNEVYFARFRVSLPEIRAQIVNVNTTVTGRRPDVDLAGLIDDAGRAETLAAAQTGTRAVWFNGDWQETCIFAREALPLDASHARQLAVNSFEAAFLAPAQKRAFLDEVDRFFAAAA